MIPGEYSQYDFRNNLIVDPDNPILIQKAWRDHFAGESFWKPGKGGGKAYLGVPNSEDALTWNVFRSLQLQGKIGLGAIADVLGLSAIESVLFWGCDVEARSNAQQLLNILIRTVDGQLKGTMTEPDIVIVTEHEVAFVECKLNLNGNQSPWKAQGASAETESGAMRRMKSYIQVGFKELSGFTEWVDIYQLIRQYVYATRMAEILKREPVVIPLINADHRVKLQQFYTKAQDSPLNCARIFRDMVTWQAIAAGVAKIGLEFAAALGLKMSEAIEASRGRRTKQ